MNPAVQKRLLRPYYTQETGYTCGAACMRMALEELGIRRSERHLARLLCASTQIGIAFQHMAALAERYRLNYSVRRNATIAELRKLHDEGMILIVCYYLEKERVGHYAVVRGLSTTTITLADPHLGPSVTHALSSFSKLWHSDPRSKDLFERHWCLALRRASRRERP